MIASGAFNPDKPEDGNPTDARAVVNDTPIYISPNKETPYDLENDWHEPSAADSVSNQEPDDLGLGVYYTTKDLEIISDRLRALFLFLVDGLEKSDDVKMHYRASVIRMVTGHGQPDKQADIAKRFGLAKQTVSSECRKLLRQLGLPSTRWLWSNEKANKCRVSFILRNLNDGFNDVNDAKRLDREQGIFLKRDKMSHAWSD